MTGTIGQGRRRGLRVAATFVAVVLLAACGGSDDESSGTTTTTTEKPAKTTTTTAADTTSTTGGSGAADAWAATAVEHRGDDGTVVDYDCPADGTPTQIWGTETYTDDSSVCTAAVHVGLITVAEGGTVTIEIQPGEASYEAGEGHGITSEYYGRYEGSFTFPDAPPGSGEFATPATSWSQTAASLAVGDQRTLRCSPDGTPGSVWGTGTYTADSSICTAAVLEGRFTLAEGGTVTAEVVPGEDAYQGSSANGVTSQDYGAYSLSFELAGE